MLFARTLCILLLETIHFAFIIGHSFDFILTTTYTCTKYRCNTQTQMLDFLTITDSRNNIHVQCDVVQIESDLL
jgi:hypothetical protein